MRYGLARQVLASSAVEAITEAEYDQLVAARAALLDALFVEQKFDLLIENYLNLSKSF